MLKFILDNAIYVLLFIVLVYILKYLMYAYKGGGKSSCMCGTNLETFAKSEHQVMNIFKPVGIQNPPYKLNEDKLFNDIIYFENDNEPGGLLGIEKCVKSCQGNCVEYGITGHAHCFPTRTVSESYYQKFQEMDSDMSTENIDQRENKLEFPNMR